MSGTKSNHLPRYWLRPSRNSRKTHARTEEIADSLRLPRRSAYPHAAHILAARLHRSPLPLHVLARAKVGLLLFLDVTAAFHCRRAPPYESRASRRALGPLRHDSRRGPGSNLVEEHLRYAVHQLYQHHRESEEHLGVL